MKLLDFGIAKIAASTMTSAGACSAARSTWRPSRCPGREVDGRADVFAAGVVLYELLSQHRPFEAETPTAVMMKIVSEDPQPLSKFCPDLPPALIAAVMKALQREPPRRFPHAGDFAAELKLVRLAAERGAETQADRVAGPGADHLHSADAGTGAGAATVAAGAAAPPVVDPGRHDVDGVGAGHLAADGDRPEPDVHLAPDCRRRDCGRGAGRRAHRARDGKSPGPSRRSAASGAAPARPRPLRRRRRAAPARPV